MGEIYLHTDIFDGNSSSGSGPRPSPLCAATAAGCTQDNAVPSSQTNQAVHPTSAVAAGSGLVHRHCSHSLTGCPSPLSLGRVFSSACPQATSPSWLGMPGTPGSSASWQDGRGFVQARWKSEAYCSQHPLFPLSPDLMTGTLPALQTSLPLGSTHTLTSHTEPLQVSPALPHHTTNGPQSPADQSCTTVETRSALPMPTSLNHS